MKSKNSSHKCVWAWQGNCVNSFDEDGNCVIDIFSDVSDFANVNESAVRIELTDADVIQAPPEVPKTLTFSRHVDRDLLIGYDDDTDVHHFFTRFWPKLENRMNK